MPTRKVSSMETSVSAVSYGDKGLHSEDSLLVYLARFPPNGAFCDEEEDRNDRRFSAMVNLLFFVVIYCGKKYGASFGVTKRPCDAV